MTDAQQSRVTKLVVFRPLNEADLHYDLRTDPVSAQAREADGFGEWRVLDLQCVELAAQVKQELRVKADADLAGKYKVWFRVVIDPVACCTPRELFA